MATRSWLNGVSSCRSRLEILGNVLYYNDMVNKKELLAKAKLASALIEDKETRVVLGLLIDNLKIDIDKEKPTLGFGTKEKDADGET